MRLFLLAILAAAAPASAQSITLTVPVTNDRWNYPFNFAAGDEERAPIFAALREPGFDDRDSTFLLGFATGPAIPAGLGAGRYRVVGARLRVVVSSEPRFAYDPTFDAATTSYAATDPLHTPDSDAGKPMEVFAAGFRNGVTPATYTEATPYSTVPSFPPQEGTRSVFPATYNAAGSATDVSRHVRQRFEAPPLAIGQTDATPGQLVPAEAIVTFDLDVDAAGFAAFAGRGLDAGQVVLVVTSLHPATGGPGGGIGPRIYPEFYAQEAAVAPVLGYIPTLVLAVIISGSTDFDGDGDEGTDADIEAFFTVLAGGACPTGTCGSIDFDGDGDEGTDADIEAFFCTLAGGTCG